MRIESDSQAKNGGWLHDLDGEAHPEYNPPPPPARQTDAELDARFRPMCREWFDAARSKVRELAGELNVWHEALVKLRVGWDGTAWTFPEKNHLGQIVGVNRRFPRREGEKTKKICVLGSHRGLSYPFDWLKGEGPILIVEGGSDVAAAITMGFVAIGRPSNTGGAELIGKLLAQDTRERKILVLGEEDRKMHAELAPQIRDRHNSRCSGCQACWPGKFGATETAEKLRKALLRPVDWAFLPSNEKDLRDYLDGFAQEFSKNVEVAAHRKYLGDGLAALLAIKSRKD